MRFVASPEEKWAEEEFGQVALGDKRREKRLRKMAASAAKTPGGSIAATLPTPSEREAAYRAVESSKIGEGPIILAAATAAFGRADAFAVPFVYVPVDQSTLTISAATEAAGYGPVGTDSSSALGIESMNALLVDPQGVPLGVGGQHYWVRRRNSGKKPHPGQRPLEETEISCWLRVMEMTLTAQRDAKSSARPWFQLDRGGDARDILFWASVQDAWVTVRAAQDRRVEWPREGLLWDVALDHEVACTHELHVPATTSRKARTAKLEIRFGSVVLPLENGWTKKRSPIEAYFVLVREPSPPAKTEPIEWMLLTNRAVKTPEEALDVVEGYAQRWRIEEVHKTWKSICKVESAALEADHLPKWAALLFAIAIRIERLKRIARSNGAAPASTEFTRYELEALHLIRKGTHLREMPTLEQAVRWIAEIGGYMGSPSKGPPGSITLGRGLQTLGPAAKILELADHEK